LRKTWCYLHGSSLNWEAILSLYKSFDSSMGLAKKEKEGGSIVIPELGQL